MAADDRLSHSVSMGVPARIRRELVDCLGASFLVRDSVGHGSSVSVVFNVAMDCRVDPLGSPAHRHFVCLLLRRGVSDDDVHDPGRRVI